ncbi:MAG: HEAT repeat domain-containing protein [Planctomycetota bacterium]
MRTRLFLAPLLLTLLAFPVWADGNGSDKAAEAARRLKEAYAAGADDMMIEALAYATGVDDPEVIKLVGKGLWTKNSAVIEASLRALGRTDSKEALKVLHRAYRRVRGRKLDGNEHLFALLFKAIGRHGDPSSVEIFTDRIFSYLTREVGQARIMGLGNVRTPEAVDALIQFTRQAGGRGRGMGVASSWRGVFQGALRTALVTLTGHDEGDAPSAWDTWWRDHRKEMKISKERPQVPKDVSRAWERYWGIPYYAPGDEPAPPTLRPPFEIVSDPTKEQAEQAVAALKAAFKTRDDDAIIVAIENHAGILDKKVVHEVARGARSRSSAVRLVAVDALGWMRYKPALRQLHRLLKRQPEMHKKDESLFAAVLKGIGRAGDESSIKVLTKSPFKGLTQASGTARIYGLARIRTSEALAELIKGTQLSGSARPRSWRAIPDKLFVKEYLLALTVLTGLEKGRSLEEWRRWWRKNRKIFQIPKTPPPIPEAMRKIWEEYWNEPYGG